LKLVFPYPPSVNRMWRSYVPKGWKRAIVVLTPEAKAYKEQVGWMAKEQGVRKLLTGPVEIRLMLVPKNRVCMDLSNCWKVAEDALNGIVYGDDAQVFKIIAERADPDPTGARLEVEILPLALPMALEQAA